MTLSEDEREKIEKLRKQGLSGSKIAQKVHRRKQTVLDYIRKSERKPKQKATVQGKGSQRRLRQEPTERNEKFVKGFVRRLYREGYSKSFITKIASEKKLYSYHGNNEVSKAYIKRYLKELDKDPELVVTRAMYKRDIKTLGGNYPRNRQEGLFYRETEGYYRHSIDWDEYNLEEEIIADM